MLTVWKLSKYGVFPGPYFPVLGLNTEIYGVNLRIQSKYRKTRIRKTPHLDIFHAVALRLFVITLMELAKIAHLFL